MHSSKPMIHLSYIRALYLLFVKIRKGGLLAIEQDIEEPENPSSIFSGYPELLDHPQHFNFMLDILRLSVNGYFDIPLLTFFASTARKTFEASSREDEALWDCIFATIFAQFSGVTPIFSAEFGRQAIPYENRPSFPEFEEFMKLGGLNFDEIQNLDDMESRHRIESKIDEIYRKMDVGEKK